MELIHRKEGLVEDHKRKKPRTEGERCLQGDVHVAYINGRSEVINSFSTYPLKIMQQENWNAHVTLSLLGYGGGMISGDAVNLSITIDEGATACIKTVGSTKIFKAVGSHRCSQVTNVNLGRSSFFVMTPDPITCYQHSNFSSKQRYVVHEDSSAVVVDWFSSGRMNREEYWNFDSFENHFIMLNQRNQFLLAENQLFNNQTDTDRVPSSNELSFGALAREFAMNVFGMLILYGPKTEAIRSSLKCFQNRQTFEERAHHKHSIPFLSVNRKSDRLTVVRFMIPSIQEAYELLMEILRPLAVELNGFIPFQDRVHYEAHDEASQKTEATIENDDNRAVIGSSRMIDILRSYRNSLVESK